MDNVWTIFNIDITIFIDLLTVLNQNCQVGCRDGHNRKLVVRFDNFSSKVQRKQLLIQIEHYQKMTEIFLWFQLEEKINVVFNWIDLSSQHIKTGLLDHAI